MPSAPAWDNFRCIFNLSMVSNKLIPYRGPANLLTEQLQVALSQFMDVQGSAPEKYALTPDKKTTDLIGNWTLQWGPMVKHSADYSGIAQNAVFVARSDDLPKNCGITGDHVYVVAIAATNPFSMIDWVYEDGDVRKVVAFNDFNPASFSAANNIEENTPYLSYATALGLSDLTTVSPEKSALGNDLLLMDYLSSAIDPETRSKSTLIFTGHSLAGALSPALAAHMKKAGLLDDFQQVLVYPTAGATPGNDSFADYFNSSFTPCGVEKETEYSGWNLMHWNELDVVPHAWALGDDDGRNPANMTEIATLYGNPGPYGEESDQEPDSLNLIKKLVDLAQNQSRDSGIEYTMLQNSSLTGSTVVANIPPPNGKSVAVPPDGTLSFLKQLGWQHVGAYENLLILPYTIANQSDYKMIPGLLYVDPERDIDSIIALLKKLFPDT